MSRTTSINGNRSKVKVVMLGDQGVGKTSIIEKFVHNKFEEIGYVIPVTLSLLWGSISWRRTSSIIIKE